MLEFLSWQTKIIHVELEFIILEFLLYTSSSSSASANSSFSIFQFCSFGSAFYFSDRSTFSKSLFFFFGFVFSISFFLFFFLLIWFFGSSDHLHLYLRSLDTSIELEFEKLEFHVDKLLHLSTRTRVFEARFCHLTQA